MRRRRLRTGPSAAGGYLAAQVTVMPPPTPVPWKPNSVDWPAERTPFQLALVNWTAPVLPLRSELQWWVTAAPAGRFAVTVQPLIGDAPAVT